MNLSALNPRNWMKRASIESPNTPLSKAYEFLRKLLGASGRSTAGVDVSPRVAMTLAAWWQGVSMISGDIGKLPISGYAKLKAGGRDIARELPAHRLLRRKPNPVMTAKVFKQTMIHHAIVRGNGYAFIERNGAAEPIELWPLDPVMCPTFPIREAGQLWYCTSVNGKLRKVAPENMFHLRGMGDDGLRGYPVIELAASSLGLSIAVEDFGAEFFENGATTSGIIEYPGSLDEKAEENLRKTLQALYVGNGRRHRLAIFEEGMKFNPTSMPNEQAQFLGTREHQRRDIAGWLHIPPSRLGDVSSRTWASLEQDGQNYLDSALEPWLVTYEEEAWDKLLTEKQKTDESHYFEFNRNALMRVDAASRATYYHYALQDGWMNRDEVRESENRNPIPNGEGQKFFVPLNMALTDESPGDKKKRRRSLAQRTASPSNPEALAQHRQLIVESARRIIKRVTAQARDAAKDPNKKGNAKRYCEWLDTMPTLRVWAEADMATALQAVRAIVGRQVPAASTLLMDRLEDDLRSLADNFTPEELYERVNETMTAREAEGPDWLADQVIKKSAAYELVAA